jgi:hypothetical protein
VQRARRAFRRRVHRYPARRLIFVDEFGTHLGLTRRFARARRGQRAVGRAPVNTDPNVTLTMGLALRGLVAPWAFEGATDGAAFETYVRTQLAPRLRAGDIVVVDGLGAHRTHGARQAVRARGAKYWMLPPYSPELSPVEQAGSKVKEALRAAEARSVPALYDAMGPALRRVTPRDARGWFAHAGYGPMRRKPADRRRRATVAPRANGPPRSCIQLTRTSL